MKKIATKILISIIIAICAVMVMGIEVNAETTTIVDESLAGDSSNSANSSSIAGKGIQDIIEARKKFREEGKKANNSNTSVSAFIDNLIGLGQVLVIIGGATLLIVGGIMAIKWITATPDKQAKLKTQSVGLVLAAVVIFGAVGIWNFVRSIMNNVDEEIDKTVVNTNKEIVYFIEG